MINDSFSTALANLSDKEFDDLLASVSVFSNIGPEIEEYITIAYSEFSDITRLYTCEYEHMSNVQEPSCAFAA